MIIFDDNIIEASIELMRQTNEKLSIMMYSITPMSSNNHKRYQNWWLELLKTCRRVESAQVILNGWAKENPQNLSTLRAATQLAENKAIVKIGKCGTIIHPKSFNFDDKFILCGSHNATEAGYMKTKNVSIISTDPIDIARFNDYFAARWDIIQ